MIPWTPQARRAEALALLDFGRRFPHPLGGAAWLGDDGSPLLDRPVFTYATARMAHVYCLGQLLGVDGSAALADAALDGLRGRLHDQVNGGWFTSIAPDGTIPDEKACYTHAFVVLAASSAVVAQRPGAQDLLLEALGVWIERFLDAGAGMFVDAWDRSFTRLDPYRGLNANMHAVEALLAAADATGDPRWLAIALDICRRVATALAPEHDGRLPEHFTPDWIPLLDHNSDRPDDQFQPFGATVGHGLEWSRLMVELEAALGDDAPTWLAPSAAAIFARAVADGWNVDGEPGFVYTTDWDGQPVVHDRMHWVLAEGLAAAESLNMRFAEPAYARLASTWWAYAQEYVIEGGSWIHQLDRHNRPADSVWSGRPDLYHAVQAMLVPDLPLAPTMARALADARESG